MVSEKTGGRFLPCPSAGNRPMFFLQTDCDYGFGLSVVLMWWTRCQHDWRLRQCLPGFNKTNSLLCPLTLPALFGKQSLSKSHLWNSPELFGEILLSPTCFLIWSYVQWLGTRVQYSFIYSFCNWNYFHFDHWGLCWLLGPVVLSCWQTSLLYGRHWEALQAPSCIHFLSWA